MDTLNNRCDHFIFIRGVYGMIYPQVRNAWIFVVFA